MDVIGDNEMIDFSVVIPLYNKEEEIVETINSVINQSYVPKEIIVVNDGSTDRSLDIVLDKFKTNRLVRIVNQENKGVSEARNKGISESSGDYVCFLDADDFWERDFLKEIASLIEKFPEAIFFSTAHKLIDERGNVLKNKTPRLYGIIENFPKVFRRNYGIINSSSVCVKRKVLDVIKFPVGEKKGEDICMWLELSLHGKLAFSDKPLSLYRLNASNRSNKIHSEPIIPCQLKWWYKKRKNLKNNIYYDDYRSFIYSNLIVNVYGGLALDKNYDNIRHIIKFMKDNNDWRWIWFEPALYIPTFILEYVKKLRRKIR